MFIPKAAVAAIAAIALAAQGGCEDKSSPTGMADGVRVINKNMRGYWTAPGGAKCRWWITSADGKTVTHPGNTKGAVNRRVQKNKTTARHSQAVIIGTGNVNHKFRSDSCGGWTKKK
jgi:hypothetical protein